MQKESSKEIRGLAKILLIAVSLILGLPILLIAAVFYFLWGVILYVSVWLTWRKQFVLFVYSDSPIWKEYIEREILPLIKDRSITLNWSDRKKWKTSLPTLVFRYFGGTRDFNPIAIVLRPFQPVKTYRFYQAFKKFKHGNPTGVEEIKTAMFRNLGIKTLSHL